MIFWKLLSFLGSEQFYLLVMPVLLWCFNARLGLRVGVLFLLSANLNGALKLFFHAPRPAWLDIKIFAHAWEPSFGFPSGHAQNAVAVWGLLAAKAKTRLAWGIALVLCVFIGLSRLALNVHFPGDVLGGWFIGALLLGAFLKLEKPLGAWLLRQDLLTQLVICAAVSLLSIGLNVGAYRFNSDWQMPRDWSVGFPHPGVIDSFQPFSKTSGALYGFLIGACWMLKNGGYVDGENRIVRYLIGLFGVGVFWFGLGKVLPRGEDIVSLGAAYMRYALVGFWISCGAPLIFRRIESRPPVHPNPLRSS